MRISCFKEIRFSRNPYPNHETGIVTLTKIISKLASINNLHYKIKAPHIQAGRFMNYNLPNNRTLALENFFGFLSVSIHHIRNA